MITLIIFPLFLLRCVIYFGKKDVEIIIIIMMVYIIFHISTRVKYIYYCCFSLALVTTFSYSYSMTSL